MKDEPRKLLFLDDEPHILTALKRTFFEDNMEIATFTQGKEALEYLRQHPVE
ncbi:MAG TPA: response regulator, partial [Bacteroidetes bacterium]|nr:response regulator [Bacteroidota bacterium]